MSGCRSNQSQISLSKGGIKLTLRFQRSLRRCLMISLRYQNVACLAARSGRPTLAWKARDKVRMMSFFASITSNAQCEKFCAIIRRNSHTLNAVLLDERKISSFVTPGCMPGRNGSRGSHSSLTDPSKHR